MTDRTGIGAVDVFLDRHPEHRALAGAVVAAGMGRTFAKYLGGADDAQIRAFFGDLARCDLAWIGRHRDALQGRIALAVPDAADLAVVPPGRVTDDARDDLERIGRASLAAGEWADLVFAGGAATRFYSEGLSNPKAAAVIERFGAAPPKGLFPVTPVAGRSFLERFASEALAVGIGCGRLPPLVLMTSGVTHGAIRDWASRALLQGFPKAALLLLTQTENPRLDEDGDLVVADDGHLVVTGDGHGGVFKALAAPGPDGTSLAQRLRDAGIRGVVLHNVDNAAAHPFDAARLGYHLRGGYAFTMTVVERARLSEKVGLVARNSRTGRTEVIEYSVCPQAVTEAARPDGAPLYLLAHINTNLVDLHGMRTDLPPTLYTGKKVVLRGRTVASSSYEMLNQHLAGLLDGDRVGTLLVDRDGFFLPTKSIQGEDSLETTMACLARQDAARLAAAGASVGPGAVVELDACLDLPPDGAAGWRIGAGASLFLGARHGLDGGLPYAPDLALGEGAHLSIDADLPYGNLRYDPATRAVAEDPVTAGRVRIGRGVTVAPGARISVRIEGDGCLVVPDGTRFEGSREVVVPPWTVRTL